MGATLNRGASRQDYQTPTEFLDAARKRLAISTFTWDLAASDENKVAPFFYNEEQNSLAQDWDSCGGWLWLNPPFDPMKPWVEKAASCKESQIAMLVPAAVGSNWWRDYVHQKAHVLILNGRIKFVGHTHGFPKDLALLLYTPYIKQGSYEVWNWKQSPANS
jgi:phage N-6-adenine-methyltransferase